MSQVIRYTWSMSLSDQLRRAIRDSGLSANAMSKEVGIPQPTISMFLQGKDILLEKNGDKLAAYFGLELRPADAAKPKSKRAKKKPARRKKSG